MSRETGPRFVVLWNYENGDAWTTCGLWDTRDEAEEEAHRPRPAMGPGTAYVCELGAALYREALERIADADPLASSAQMRMTAREALALGSREA